MTLKTMNKVISTRWVSASFNGSLLRRSRRRGVTFKYAPIHVRQLTTALHCSFHQIVDSIEAKGEGSTSLQEIFTPKPGTRIVTSGSSTIKRSNSSQRATPRISFAIPDRRSLAPLPEPEWSIDGDDSDDPAEDGHGNSVTLRDILLKAGELSRFELLDDDENGGELEAGSFRWE
jgi:hypothetical protein